jgi:alpha-galactosidase
MNSRYFRFLAVVLVAAGASFAADLSGNWAVTPGADGAIKSYLDLKQQGSQITGHIRVSQFYYTIKESVLDPDGGFTLKAGMMEGRGERTVVYQLRLVGDELQISGRRPGSLVTTGTAHRVPDGEGAWPARVPPSALPALHTVPYNGLAKTPPMGWNSWNKFAGGVTDADIRAMADAMASNGMKEAGYTYINIDDTWEGNRDAKGYITSNKKFPDMKVLADYVHSKGLKMGIYSSPGPNTCAGYEGSFGHEEQDAKTYAAWGVDYLKYDWCSSRFIYTGEEVQAVYQKMGDALLATGRPIVYSLCQYGNHGVWKWGSEVGGNLWRTTYDIEDSWDSMSRIGFKQQDGLAQYAAPGHWNDPDMLEIGNGGMTDTEYRTHMSLWSMLAAPLLAGNDLRAMSPSILAILTNGEVIAIDQDKGGKQGQRVWQSGDQEVWVRELDGGDTAVAVFNRGAADAEVKVEWVDLKVKAPAKARDLWAHQDVKLKGDSLIAKVPSHGVVMWRVR